MTETVCWQYLKRQEYANDPVPPALPLFKPGRAQVKPISKDQARAVILKYEWLGSMAQTAYHYGIFYGDHLAGVTCFNVGGAGLAGINSHKEFKLQRGELACLARGACVHWAPKGTNSRLVAQSCKQFKKDVPAARLVIAYADPAAGEMGTIYQACNWTHTGKTWKGRRWIGPDGQDRDWKYPYDLKRQHGGTRKQWAEWLREQGWTVKVLQAKLKYVWVLDKRDKDLIYLIQGKAQSYPKRSL